MEEKLPEGWVWTTLGTILPIQYGKGLTEVSRDKDGNVPVYGSSGIVGYHNQALTSNETLIVGRKGSVGSVYYSPDPCWPIDTTYFVEKIANINLKFFLHLLFSLQLVKLDKSTAIPGLSRDDYNDITIKIPPFPEQSRIVSVIEQQFTRLDSAVASLKSAKARIKQYRASLLKSAVEGELTREWRAEHPVSETGEQLLERILQERRVRWEEEQLRRMREKGLVPKDEKWKEKYEEPQEPDVENLPELPEGWRYTFLQPLLAIDRKGMVTGPFGSLLKKHEHLTEGIPVFGIENIASMKFVAGNKIYITQDKASELSQYDALPGDILISRSGTVGEVCVVPENLGEARISTNLMRVSLIKNGMLSQFFCILFNGSPFVLDQVSELCKGSTRDFLSQAILSQIIFPLPPFSEQVQIIAEVEARLSNIDQLEKTTEDNLKRAERERQSILQEAFAGRLVPQDPNDEPASILLERIREERKEREETEKVLKVGRKGSSMDAAKKRRAKKVAAGEAGVGLYEVLVEAGEPLRPEEVFRLVGLKTEDQPESVEAFYVELRADVADDLVGVTRPDTTTILLEALDGSVEEEEEAAHMEQVEDAEEEGELAVQLQKEDEKVSSEWPTLWDELDNE